MINRLPHFYRSSDTGNLLHQFVQIYGALLDQAEEDLMDVMRSHWVDTANNILPGDAPTSAKGDLDQIITLFLESLGGTALLRQRREAGEDLDTEDELYRRRILGLIKSLGAGASSKAGIRNIVGANLGIVSGDFGADKALEQIQIVEFLPQITPLTFDAMGGSTSIPLKLFQSIEVRNPNPIASPASIKITVNQNFPSPLIRPGIVNLTTGKGIFFDGTILVRQVDGQDVPDVLEFFSNGTATLNAAPINQHLRGELPFLPRGKSNWRFESSVGLAAARFDQSLFDFSKYDEASIDVVARFDEPDVRFDEAIFQVDMEVVSMEMELTQLFPASFRLRVPWDVPGFTVSIKVSDYSLGRLLIKGYSEEDVNKIAALKDQEFIQLSAFNEALNDIFDGIPPAGLLDDLLPLTGGDDLFKSMSFDPRRQIPGIVDKVRAAGVNAEVTYEKVFVEDQELEIHLEMSGRMRAIEEDIEMEEENFDVESQKQSLMDQQLEERLIMSAIFDYTQFDTSLNGFA